jgi:hypothetical protein
MDADFWMMRQCVAGLHIDYDMTLWSGVTAQCSCFRHRSLRYTSLCVVSLHLIMQVDHLRYHLALGFTSVLNYCARDVLEVMWQLAGLFICSSLGEGYDLAGLTLQYGSIYTSGRCCLVGDVWWVGHSW